jgi:hypothetical protein
MIGTKTRWRTRLLALGGLACSIATSLSAGAPIMRPYTIDLPHHVLRFSLPEEIAQQMAPLQVEKYFAPTDAAYKRDGFRDIASKYYQIQGHCGWGLTAL